MAEIKPVKITDTIYHIYESCGVYCTLVLGTKAALLIDTGYGFGDILNKVRDITDLPLKVINTHGHVDHIQGNKYFDSVMIHEYLMEQKKNGRIKHLGFSAHGSVEVMKRFIDAYGKDMEFCQIQLNWLDWNFQGAKEKVALLNEHHIPIWVMEPLRGGRLTKLSPKDEAQLKLLRPEANIASWAFRFLQSIPGVTMILSGMSNLAQMKDNIATFEKDLPLNKTEINTLFHIADGMLGNSLPCTSCHYCVSHCPQGIDIPKMISLYNEHSFSGGGFLAPMTIMALPDNKKPAACRHCHSCEKVCPQGIKISEAMTVLAEKAHW